MDTAEAQDPTPECGLRLRPRRVAGLVLGFAIVAAGAEVGLRMENPTGATNAVRSRTFGERHPMHPDRGIYQLDEELGFRPAPDNGIFGPHGARLNEYQLAKDPDRERVLFLGDSILERGTLLRAIREEFGEEDYEWWNAGVGAYATGQEVGFYRDYLGPLEADRVVLVFNMTDYEVTPLMTLDADGKLQILNARRSGTNAWLLQHSQLYRYYVGRTMAAPAIGQFDESLFGVVEDELEELRDLVRERKATLTVLVIPWMRPVEMWTPRIWRNHARTLEMLDRLGIRHFVALSSLEETTAAGQPLGEPAGDLMHPGSPLCKRFAVLLRQRGFLAPD